MGDVIVAQAAEHEAPACLALLPEVQGLAPELLIARRDGVFAGAAAVLWRTWSEPGGFPLHVHVLPAQRRKGVGRALVQGAAALAAGETAGLWSMKATAEDGVTADFLRACGFALRRGERHFIGDVDTALAFLGPQAARMQAHGHVPADARIVALAEAPLDAVSWLVSSEFGGGPVRALHGLHQRAASHAAGSRRDRSLAAMQGDQVAGVMLCRTQDGVGVIDGWVTAPRWRNGWTNLLLLEALLARAQRDGFEEYRFHCEDQAAHTLALARRCAAAEVARLGNFYCAVAAA
jgi:GNAT superfamily N-acetyltransferase